MGDLRNDIERYLKGEMNADEMHALEKRALHDPFLADALEGGAADPHNFTADIDELNARIAAKVKRKPQGLPWYYQAAAAVLLVGVSAFLIFYLGNRQQAVTPLTMNQQTEKSNPEYTPGTDTHSRENSPPSEEPTEERRAETEATTPPSSEADAIARAPEEHIADIAPDEPASAAPAEASDSAPESLPDDLRDRDSMQVRSFALRQEAKKETAGRAARASAIFKSRETDIGGVTIRGKVTDIDDGLPLPGVNVLVKGTEQGTVTDLNGNFEFQISDSTESLVFSFVGLQTREIKLPASSGETPPLNVQMEPDVSSLSEVVVVGYDAESDFEFESVQWEPAEPAGGKRAFKRYLESNLRYPEAAIENNVEGKVTIQFTIDPTGTLTDFRVVRGLGYGCDEEVIRLIRNGPQWNPTKRNDKPVLGKAKVKMKFELPEKK